MKSKWLHNALLCDEIKEAWAVAPTQEEAAAILARFILSEGMAQEIKAENGKTYYRIWVAKPEAME